MEGSGSNFVDFHSVLLCKRIAACQCGEKLNVFLCEAPGLVSFPYGLSL